MHHSTTHSCCISLTNDCAAVSGCHLRACVTFSPPAVCLSSTSTNLHSYARPPPPLPSGTVSPPRGHVRERRRSRVETASSKRKKKKILNPSSWLCGRRLFCLLCPQKSSECGSAVSTRSSLSDEEDMGWNFSWPPTAWHCFLKGRHTNASCTLHTELERLVHAKKKKKEHSGIISSPTR